MTNNQIIRKAAEMAGIYTPETFTAYLRQFGTLPLHTYSEWRRMGKQVKQGEHAILTLYLWKFNDGRKADDLGDPNAPADDTEQLPAGPDFYKTKAHLFDVSQTEPTGKCPAPHVKTPAEIAAYNAMLAEQRRAAKAAKALQAANRIAATLDAPGWLALPEKATGAQAPAAPCKRSREQISAAAACRRIYNSSEHTGPQYAGIMHTGDRYTLTDGYRAIRFNADLPDFPRAEKALDVDSLFAKTIAKATTPAQLPTVAELRGVIAAHKAAHKGSRKAGPALYQMGAAWFDAGYLLDVLQVLPGCSAYNPASSTAPAYFTAANGDALLLPVRR